MTIEDPVIGSIFSALGLLPEAAVALEGIARNRSCDAAEQRLIQRLTVRMHKQDFLAERDLRDVDVLLATLADVIGGASQQVWVHDEHCIAGGWYETFVPPHLAELEGHCRVLQWLQIALRTVHDVVRARRLGYQLTS